MGELEVSRADLRRLRDAGLGPTYFKIGSASRYLPADVQAWIEEQSEGTKVPRRRRL
jgi:helix-turn-helix protein